MRNATIVFFDAGGGHRNAAEALRTSLQQQDQPWRVELLNLQEQLDPLDIVRRATGIRLQDSYNLLLRKGWTRPSSQLLPILRAVIRLRHARIVALLEKYWRTHPTDLALSVIPLFNRALAESLQSTCPGTSFATLLTDMADFPPHFWIEDESEYLICGTRRAEQQALVAGHLPDRVFRTSGMILKSEFYEKRRVDVAAERKRLGLDPMRPTGIVLFGGHGAPVMFDIAQRLQNGPARLQLIMMCGHNRDLRDALKMLPCQKPMLVQGFTSEVDYYMSLSDFFIGKPGPGSISEALQCGLPVIIERNGRTLPQERYNADWVTENGFGIVLSSFEHVSAGVEYLLEPTTFRILRANAKTYSNRALFEVPQILDDIFEREAASSITLTPALAKSAHQIELETAWASLT